MTIQFTNVGKHNQDTMVFTPFCLTVLPGQVVAIATNVNIRELLIEILQGKQTLSSGSIEILQKPVSESVHKIGFFFLIDGLYERLTVREHLKFVQQLYTSKVLVDEAVELLQLGSFKNKRIKDLQYSEKKRVQLANLLIQNPLVFVLEEPDQNVDLETKRILMNALDYIRQNNCSVLLLTSNVESAVTVTDQVYRLDEQGLRQIHTNEDTTEFVEEEGFKEKTPIRFEKIPTKINEKLVLFNPPEIDYIESVDGQSFLHIKGESFPCVFNLSELEEKLLHFGFFRCHRSYIVNLQRVKEVITWTRNSYSLVLEGVTKSTIPLSKTKMIDLKQMLGLK